MSALDDLIARLEAAKEGSRELDCRIFELVGGVDGMFFGSAIVRFLRAHDGWYDFTTADGFHHLCAKEAPHYTTSLDAALTLVPEGHDYGFSFSKQYGLEAWVQKPFKQSECFQGYAPDGDMTDKTRAKAMSVAALKARGEP